VAVVHAIPFCVKRRLYGLPGPASLTFSVVVLECVDQRRRIDPQRQRLAQREPQELGVAGHQGVVVGRAVDEVVRQIRAGRAHHLDVVHGEVELLEREAAHLAHHARDQVVRGLRQRVALRPRRLLLGALLGAQEAVGVEPQPPGPQVGQGVQRVADHQPHAGERRVEPVDRGLALLEVVQVDPAA
jgi:hypothetical protein